MKHSPKQVKNNISHKSRPYRCPLCGYYHFTSMTKSESKRAKKQHKEKKRRLNIIKRIRKSGELTKIFELQEHWMTLIINSQNWVLECEIFGEVYAVESQ